MKIKNFLTIPALALALVGCGQKAEAPTENTAEVTDNPQPVASELISDGVLTVGTSVDFPPFEYYEGNDIVGIDPDVVNAIGAELGVKVEFKDMEFNNIIASLASGRVDMGAAGLTVNEERKKNVDFTDFYATSVQVILKKDDDSSINGADDLAGKKIGTQLGSVGDIYAKDDYGDDAVNSFAKYPDAVLALQNGKVDAIIMDKAPAEAFAKANTDLAILEESYADEEYAYALPKGNDELLKEINEIIAKLKADGVIDEAMNKHTN